jgi:hypothetical protein
MYSSAMIHWLLEKERFHLVVKDRYLIFSITHLAMIAGLVIVTGIAVLWFKTGIMWFRSVK